MYVGDVRFLVLDEADTMFDRGFGPEVAEVVAAVKGKPSPADAVLACATLSRKVQKLVLDHLPKAERIATDTFHRRDDHGCAYGGVVVWDRSIASCLSREPCRVLCWDCLTPP